MVLKNYFFISLSVRMVLSYVRKYPYIAWLQVEVLGVPHYTCGQSRDLRSQCTGTLFWGHTFLYI